MRDISEEFPLQNNSKKFFEEILKNISKIILLRDLGNFTESRYRGGLNLDSLMREFSRLQRDGEEILASDSDYGFLSMKITNLPEDFRDQSFMPFTIETKNLPSSQFTLASNIEKKERNIKAESIRSFVNAMRRCRDVLGFSQGVNVSSIPLSEDAMKKIVDHFSYW